MSETLLNYTNKEVKLSKVIKNIDSDFKNGYLFGELLLKTGNIKKEDLSSFSKTAKTQSEIRSNYQLLKTHLAHLGIHLDDFTINELIKNIKGAPSNLLYKIKTQIDRNKINFDDIMKKILIYDTESKKGKNETKCHRPFNKTQSSSYSNFPSNKFQTMSYMSTFYGTGTLNNFNNLKEIPHSGKALDIINSDKNNLKNINNRIKLEPIYLSKLPKISIGQDSNNLHVKLKNLSKVSEGKEGKDKRKSVASIAFNPIQTTEILTNTHRNKYNSLREEKKKIKINTENFFDSNKYMKYSCFDRNSLKIGIDIKEIDPKLKKQGIGLNSDYIPTDVVMSRLKQKVNKKEEEEKKLLEEKKFLTEEEKILKYSILNQNIENEGKMFTIKFKKDSNLYKMHEYEKYREETFPLPKKVDKRLVYRRENSTDNENNLSPNKAYATATEKMYTRTILTNFSNADQFDLKSDEQFCELEKQTIEERKENINNKKLLREKNSILIKDVVNLIIDLSDESFNYQKKNNIELVDIPEFKYWLNSFIDGKISVEPIENKGGLINLVPENKNNNLKSDINITEYINNIKCISAFKDYLFYRGPWQEIKYIPPTVYGTQLQVYQVLGEDIIRLTASGKIVTQGIKTSLLLKMQNDEFELKEDEKDNVSLPKENTKNRLFGEIIELNFDNISSNFSFASINNNLGISSEFSVLNKQKLLASPISIQGNNNNNNDQLFNSGKELYNPTNPTNNQNNNNNIIEVHDSSNKINLDFDNNINKNVNNNVLSPIRSTEQNIIDDNALINNNNNNNNSTGSSKFINRKLNNKTDLSYIPIRICFIGHSFIGRKMQAKLLCEKYHELKCYSIHEIINSLCEKYDKLHTPLENDPKFKSMKKNQVEALKKQREDDLKEFEEINQIIEPLKLNKINDLSDEIKINFLIQEIQKDFPEKETIEKIATANNRIQEIEQQLEAIKEENDKRGKSKPKEQLLRTELDNLLLNSYLGFIFMDFPNTYSQHVKLENTLTGFIQEIDKGPEIRDIYLDSLTSFIDKPYANISNLSPEVKFFLGHNNSNTKSIFSHYIWIEITENDILLNNGVNSNNEVLEQPPPQENNNNNNNNNNGKKNNDKGDPQAQDMVYELNEIEKKEFDIYDNELPRILNYINLFHNIIMVNIVKNNENKISERIEEIMSNILKTFEDKENKDQIGNLNNFDPDESENIKYYKRLHEVKKKVGKEISDSIINQWASNMNAYSLGVREFLYNIHNLKKNIIEKMNSIQQVFIDYLNGPTHKKKLIEFFQKKYELFVEKYHQIKKHKLVQEEFQKDIGELTENFWEIIQMKKRDAINELKNIKDQKFIENQSNLFGDFLSNLFVIETNNYINKLNIIRKFYYEFDMKRYSEKCPYFYRLNKMEIFKETEDLPIFINKNSPSTSENNKFKRRRSSSIYNTTYTSLSPRIDKIYKNCFRLFFLYDLKMSDIYQKEKDSEANNSSFSSASKRKHRVKKVDLKGEQSIFSESKIIISYEDEMKAALNNEKIKYKIRITFLKYFAEHFLNEAYNISNKTFQNLDNCIIKSVDVQNNAMNSLMLKLRQIIAKASSKISYNIELDSFNVYSKCNPKFEEFALAMLKAVDNGNKKIDLIELNKIYLDLKNYEIQDNYVTLNSLVDIVFKKHLFEYKSNAFLNYLKELPYFYINNLINKFIHKTKVGRNIIKIDELFSLISIMHLTPPRQEQIKEMMDRAADKLKLHCFLTRDDFMKCKLWFENENDFNDLFTNEQSTKKVKIVEKNSSSASKREIEDNNNLNINNNNLNNNNDIIINKDDNNDKKEIGINLNNPEISHLVRNLTCRKSVSKKYPRKLENHFQSLISAPIEIPQFGSSDNKLKQFLFDVNKNSEDQINFIEFMNIISLKYMRANVLNKKKKRIKHVDRNKLLSIIKKGQLPQSEKTINEKLGDKKSTSSGAFHKKESQSDNSKYQRIEKRLSTKEREKLGGKKFDLENYKIIIEGDSIFVNNKKYNIDSFKENIFMDYTYLDELIEENK